MDSKLHIFPDYMQHFIFNLMNCTDKRLFKTSGPALTLYILLTNWSVLQNNKIEVEETINLEWWFCLWFMISFMILLISVPPSEETSELDDTIINVKNDSFQISFSAAKNASYIAITRKVRIKVLLYTVNNIFLTYTLKILLPSYLTTQSTHPPPPQIQFN